MKKKYLLFSAILLSLFFTSAGYALALETTYPNIPGLPSINGVNTDIASYVRYFFGLGIYLAGILALISFTIGAIGLINPNVEAHSDAKDRMKGAVLGLVLTFSSFIIINTINPNLTTPTVTQPPTVVIAPYTQPGIYYFMNAGCTGDGSNVITGSEDAIQSPFKGKLKSVKIVNDPANGVFFGVIFHKTAGLDNGGECSQPITNEGCQAVNISASAADVFEINQEPGLSGDGVTFYSEPYGWDAGANAGFYQMPDGEIRAPFSQKSPHAMTFDYTNVDRPEAYQTDCLSFRKCPGSIDIKGSYLVALYSSGTSYCQTFNKFVENLNTEPFVASGMMNMGDVYVVPTGGGNNIP